jgi:hypothetical protein
MLLEDAERYWITPCAANGDPAPLLARRPDDEEFLYDWSWDGKLTSLQTEDGEVNVFDAEAEFKLLATFAADTYSLAWSPTAHRLAFTKKDDGAVAAYAVDLSTQPPSPKRLSTVSTDVSDVSWVNDELLAYGAHAADGSYEAHLVRAEPPFDDRLVVSFPSDATFHSVKYDPLGHYLFFVQAVGELEQLYAVSLRTSTSKPEPVFDEPQPPSLTVEAFTPDATGLILQYQAPSPDGLGTVWWIPFDERGVERPRVIHAGSKASFYTLRPRR